jgi:hypothetical protein
MIDILVESRLKRSNEKCKDYADVIRRDEMMVGVVVFKKS